MNPLQDVLMHVNLVKMETNSTELGPTVADVIFNVRIKSVNGSLFKEADYTCPEDVQSYQMDWIVSYNIPDDETKVIVEIEAYGPHWGGLILPSETLDLTGGSNGSTDPLGVYFEFDLKTGTWAEKYGGDPELDGVTSGWDDGVGGNEVTLWYWLYT